MCDWSRWKRQTHPIPRSRSYECLVPDDALWGAVKDNLILREYERAGISLSRYTGTVIDAGAHVGLFSLQAATYASKVIALEPHPSNYTLLMRNAKRNSCPSVVTIPKALWHESGWAQFYQGQDSGGSSLSLRKGPSFKVATISLDELVGTTGNVDLLKLDIEGAEFPVLERCRPQTLSSIGSIAAEVHLSPTQGHLRNIVQRLENFGFVVTVLDPPIHHLGESLRRIVRTWKKSQGLAGLKIATLMTYTVAGVLPTRESRTASQSHRLKFLYATRASSNESLPSLFAGDL
jgi:FkbM family methyltransferase